MIQAGSDLEFEPGPHADAFAAALAEWQKVEGTRRLWDRDSTLWTGGDESSWLGWLDGVEMAVGGRLDWRRAAGASKGCNDVLLMGMGGSSLCPEVLSKVFPAADLRMHVLDSTVPASVQRILETVDLARTHFIVASKSGTTAEVSAFCSTFLHRYRNATGAVDAAPFTAITDPGSQLEALACKEGFGAVFLGEPTIGGRFSALSPFGLVPAAAYGLSTDGLLANAAGMVARCHPEMPDAENPGVVLGLLLGELARSGRDKLTFLAAPAVASLGGWIEQLLAESTGKAGQGVIPVDLEPIGDPAAYGDDRVFVVLQLAGEEDTDLTSRGSVLASAGYPVISVRLPDRLHLGAEFFRWEIATAVAGWRLGIHPFDQPNVQESKSFTSAATQRYESEGRLTEEEPLLTEDGFSLYADAANARDLVGCTTLDEALGRHLKRLQPGDYAAFCAFLDASLEVDSALTSIRTLVRDRTKVATTLGFGPRFLHSTGQLHKGGPNTGVFTQLTADDGEDVSIPGQSFSFGVLKAAQAMGDFQALSGRGRRSVRFHLGSDVEAGLARLVSAAGKL